MADEKLYELTDEHRAQLKPWAEKWIANALSTKPMDDEDRAEMDKAVEGLYQAADLEPPANIVYSPGPVTSACASCFASAVWWLRENPEEEVKLFGRALTDDELRMAVLVACGHVAEAVKRLAHPDE